MQIEEKRKSLYSIYQKEMRKAIFFLVVFIVSLILLYMISGQESSLFLVSFIFLIIAVVFFAKASKHANSFKQIIKDELIGTLLKDQFEDVSYEQHAHIGIDRINQTGMIKRPDRYKGEDYIRGSYKDVKFEVSDVELKERVERVDSKGNRTVTYETYFKGRWYIYHFERNFDGTLKIVEGKGFGVDRRGLEKVETESIQFNKKFAILSSTKEFAFYHLTPRMMEKFMELEQLHRGRIMFYFNNNELHIGVNDNKDYMEMPLRKAVDEQALKTFNADIEMIPAIINEMRLDNRRFKKQDF
jgi:Ca2+/Na+ antiporter